MKQTWEFGWVLFVLLFSMSNLCIHQPVRGRTCCSAECDDDSVFECGNNAAVAILDSSNADDGFSRESGLAEVPVERWVLVVLSGGGVDTLEITFANSNCSARTMFGFGATFLVGFVSVEMVGRFVNAANAGFSTAGVKASDAVESKDVKNNVDVAIAFIELVDCIGWKFVVG